MVFFSQIVRFDTIIVLHLAHVTRFRSSGQPVCPLPAPRDLTRPSLIGQCFIFFFTQQFFSAVYGVLQTSIPAPFLTPMGSNDQLSIFFSRGTDTSPFRSQSFVNPRPPMILVLRFSVHFFTVPPYRYILRLDSELQGFFFHFPDFRRTLALSIPPAFCHFIPLLGFTKMMDSQTFCARQFPLCPGTLMSLVFFEFSCLLWWTSPFPNDLAGRPYKFPASFLASQGPSLAVELRRSAGPAGTISPNWSSFSYPAWVP